MGSIIRFTVNNIMSSASVIHSRGSGHWLPSPKTTTHFILCSRLTTAASCLYSVGKWDGAQARIYAYNRHLSFDVAFICSTLTHCGVCHLNVWRLKWEVSYVHRSAWRWKWFFCQSNCVLQRLRLCKTSDTVFRREIDSRRQWGYGTCYGGIVSPLRRSVHQ